MENPVDATQLVCNTDFMPNYYRPSVTEFIDDYPFLIDRQPWEGTFNANNDITTYTSNNANWNYLGISARKFDIYQTLTDLPNGNYIVSCQGFYRNASTAILAANKHKNGTEALNVKFYANDKEVPIMSIVDGATEKYIGAGYAKTSYGFVPNTTQALSSYFDNELYTNKLAVKVIDGTLTFGFKNEEKTVSGDWAVIDRVRLTYYGNDIDSIEEFETSVIGVDSDVHRSITPVAIYNLNGILTNGNASGINIMRMSDGSVRKVLVK